MPTARRSRTRSKHRESVAEAHYVGTSTDFKPSMPSFDHFQLPKQRSLPLVKSEIDGLREMGYPLGLAQSMSENLSHFPLRVWVLDNSGSMKEDDGSRVASTVQHGYKVVNCTRWREMRETVLFHSEMAAKVHAPTLFRLLNKPMSPKLPREFAVAMNKDSVEADKVLAQHTVKKVEPKGCTPLSKRVWEIQQTIEGIQLELEEKREQVVVVLATDGLPTDRNGACTKATRDEFVNALKSLEGLSVWVVIRLCTQAVDVVEFYNSLDRQLDLSLEVLDDYFQEAKELFRYNKWINYAPSLHRAREMGFHHDMFNLLDERKLTLTEVKEYFSFLFGKERTESLPDPVSDFKLFLERAKVLIDEEKKVFNPIHKKDTPWIDIKRLSRSYHGPCSIM